MKNLFLIPALLLSLNYSVHASEKNIVNCVIDSPEFTSVTVKAGPSVGSNLTRLEVALKSDSTGTVDMFYPRIKTLEGAAQIIQRNLNIIADVSTKKEQKPTAKRLVLEIDGNGGNVMTLLEGNKSERSEVLNYKDSLTCTWSN